MFGNRRSRESRVTRRSGRGDSRSRSEEIRPSRRSGIDLDLISRRKLTSKLEKEPNNKHNVTTNITRPNWTRMVRELILDSDSGSQGGKG